METKRAISASVWCITALQYHNYSWSVFPNLKKKRKEKREKKKKKKESYIVEDTKGLPWLKLLISDM